MGRPIICRSLDGVVHCDSQSCRDRSTRDREGRMPPNSSEAATRPVIAYFSMEVGIDATIPTYAGGLGMLAGDMLRAAADESIDMIGISLVHRKGYFRQHLNTDGTQTETPEQWSPEDHLEPVQPRASVTIEGRRVQIQAWRYSMKGMDGHVVPLYLLDTALQENDPRDRALTDYLYGGDDRYRLSQEVILGFGGVAFLRALGYRYIRAFHMNEGHSALLTLALLDERVEGRGLDAITPDDIQAVRQRCVFTTHTPVPAGHDQFPADLVRSVLGETQARALKKIGCSIDGSLNMTYMGLFFSRYINGVSMRHEEISQTMFPNYPINAITNGVHAGTWTSPPFCELYDRHFPQWRRDNLYLRYAVSIAHDEVWEAHMEAKRTLLAEVERLSGAALDPNIMTIGFARRASPYKRGDFLFHDLTRLRKIAQDVGPFQVIYGGKAHPRDQMGKQVIQRIFQAAADLVGTIPVVYLEDYDMAIAKHLCAGVDLWLNTPQKPQEASGTSGMKAALNGIPSLSVLDGWWIEGHVEGVTGWSIGDTWRRESDVPEESESLCDKLEYVILPMFYSRQRAYARMMRSCIAINGAFFTAQRMIYQYLHHAYPAFDS